MRRGFAARLAQHGSDLWYGHVALGRVFWEYAIVIGTLLNLITTALTLVAFARGWPAAVGMAFHVLPIPYNVLMVVSVWRAAARYAGSAIWATLARALVIVWAIVAILA
jgi:hypothetical protein